MNDEKISSDEELLESGMWQLDKAMGYIGEIKSQETIIFYNLLGSLYDYGGLILCNLKRSKSNIS